MFPPYGGRLSCPARSPSSNNAKGPIVWGSSTDIHFGSGLAQAGVMRPPAPAHSPLSRFEVRFQSQFVSNVTSSSVNATTSLRDSLIPAFRANDNPCCFSNTQRNRLGNLLENSSTTSRVESVELLSMTTTSHATSSGTT